MISSVLLNIQNGFMNVFTKFHLPRADATKGQFLYGQQVSWIKCFSSSIMIPKPTIKSSGDVLVA